MKLFENQKFQAFIQQFGQWLVPPTCVLTDQPSIKFDLAEEKLLALQPIQNACTQCGYPLDVAQVSEEPDHLNHLCGQCLSDPPAFDQTMAGFAYNEVMRELVVAFKFHDQPQVGQLLFELFWSIHGTRIKAMNIEAIVPVPLHPNRLLERGFNQSLEFAKSLAKVLDVPVLPFAVQRIEDTPHQIGAKAEERKRNLKRAFACDSMSLAGYQKIAIVDDVMTTGSTLNALAKAIKTETQIEKITALVLARTVNTR